MLPTCGTTTRSLCVLIADLLLQHASCACHLSLSLQQRQLKSHKWAMFANVVAQISCCLHHQGSIYVFGGEQQPRTPLSNDVHRYDLAAGAWSAVQVSICYAHNAKISAIVSYVLETEVRAAAEPCAPPQPGRRHLECASGEFLCERSTEPKDRVRKQIGSAAARQLAPSQPGRRLLDRRAGKNKLCTQRFPQHSEVFSDLLKAGSARRWSVLQAISVARH